ncbi:MAG: T9SS type A sorting domain-containing protein, partial [Flavobacteriales bacterium]
YILARSMSADFLALLNSSSCAGYEPHVLYNDCVSQGVNDYLGISDMQAMIYPNPVSESFTIEVVSYNFQPVEVAVYNLHGKHVKQYLMINSVETVDASHLEPGVYLVSSSDGLWRSKLIKL